MRSRVIHLINPKTDSLTTRPLYLNRALYSPLAGLLAVAACIPRDRYEVVLTDENIETIDFDLQADLVGISAMTSYVNRGYEIADQFRAKGIPVVMGGVHPSFMPQEALAHSGHRGERTRQLLHRHAPSQHDVLSQVHASHRAATQRLDEADPPARPDGGG